MFAHLARRNVLLGVLFIVSVLGAYYHTKANNLYQIVFSKQSTFYTPGQHSNCKWVVHISDEITTQSGDNSSVQIGIPEVLKDGYIAGLMQNGPGQSLLFAFKLPTQSEESPPFIMTASYKEENLPLEQIRFRVFSSSLMTMVLYSSYEKCVEATMK